MLELDKIYCIDVLRGLKQLPDESIDCITTSPPYWALRDYKLEPLIWDAKEGCEHSFDIGIIGAGSRTNDSHSESFQKESLGSINRDKRPIQHFCSKCGAWKGSLGLEPTFQLYIQHLLQIFDECKRVLKKSGTCWINMGDTYSATRWTGKGEGQPMNKFKDGHRDINPDKNSGLPDKSLCQIPSRFAIAMSDHGWILRNEIIWYKRNCMPSSVKDRFTVDFEKVFFFVKNKKYWFETQYEPYLTEGNAERPRMGQGNQTIYNQKRRGLIKGNVQVGTEQHHSGNIVYGKYQDITTETTNRQGMNKLRGSKIVEKRYHLLPQKEFVDRMRQNFKVNDLVEKTGLPRTHIEHWFRYDVCFAYPSKEDWEKIGTALFPELLDVCYETDDINKNRMPPIGGIKQAGGDNPTYSGNTPKWKSGRNKRCVWNITTKPFKEAHFAVFPETLIEPMIKAGCQKDGVVLDPFMGSGTTAVVAHKLLRHYIGFEINKEYVKMAEKRISTIPKRLDVGD
jgi:site-specific DNA-methyltransferase (adenine-specific)